MEKIKNALINNFKGILNSSFKENKGENEFVYTYENYFFKDFTIDFTCELIENDKILISDEGEILRLILREGGYYKDVKEMFLLSKDEGFYMIETPIMDFLETIDEIIKKVLYQLMLIEFKI